MTGSQKAKIASFTGVKALALTMLLSLTIQASPAMDNAPETVSMPAAAFDQYRDARLAMAAKNFPKAEEGFRKAIELAPEFDGSYCDLGYILLIQGRAAEAKKWLEEAIKLPHCRALAYENLGSALHQMGKPEEALVAYKTFLKLKPGAPQSKQIASLINLLEAEKTNGDTHPFKNGADDYLGDVTTDGATRWPKDFMPLKVYIEANPTAEDYRPSLATTFKEALQEWCDASGDKIKIVYVDSPRNAQITCSWTNDKTRLSSLSEAGHTAFIKSPHGLSRSDIIFLTREPSGNEVMTDDEAKRLALHEIGHALGFTGHSSKPDDIMYASLAFGKTDSHLNERDKKTLVALYALSDADVERYARAPLPTAGDADSPVVIAGKVNNQGLAAIRAGDAVRAMAILEPAYKTYPDDKPIRLNLGIALCNMAIRSMNEHKMDEADRYFTRGLELLQDCPDPHLKASLLSRYIIFLKNSKRLDDASRVEKEIKDLGG